VGVVVVAVVVVAVFLVQVAGSSMPADISVQSWFCGWKQEKEEEHQAQYKCR